MMDKLQRPIPDAANSFQELCESLKPTIDNLNAITAKIRAWVDKIPYPTDSNVQLVQRIVAEVSRSCPP